MSKVHQNALFLHKSQKFSVETPSTSAPAALVSTPSASRPWAIAPPILNPTHASGSKRIGVTSLTFQGHVTSSVTRPFDTYMSFPIGGPIGTESLNPAVFEILRSKSIGVTS